MIEAHHHELAAVIMEPFQRLIVPQPGFLEGVREITRAPRRAARSSTRSSPASASPMAAPRSTTASCPTSPPSARSWAAASRSPRSRAGEDIMRHFAPELDGTGDFVAAGGHAQRQPDRRRGGPRHPRRAAQARRLCAPLRDGHAAQGRARGGRGRRRGLPAQVAGEAPVFEIFFTDRPITDYRATPRRRPRAPRRLHAGDARARRGQGRAEDLRVARA